MIDVTSAPQVVEHASVSPALTPFDARWIPFSARVALIGMQPKGSGILRVYDLQRGELTVRAETIHEAGLKCGTFTAGRHLATGDFNGHLCTWDVDCMQIVTRIDKAHASLINCIDAVAADGCVP